jgi:hypothetical protein
VGAAAGRPERPAREHAPRLRHQLVDADDAPQDEQMVLDLT